MMTEVRPLPLGPVTVLPVPPPQAASTSPLEESDFERIREAVKAHKAVRRATRTALSSASVTLVIAFAAMPFTLIWPSVSGLLVLAGISAVGIVEFLGYQRMRRADPSAPKMLALNQLAFLGVITLYCISQVAFFSTADIKASALSPEFRAELTKGMPDMARSTDALIDQWAPLAMFGFYSLVVLLSIVFQGGMALYYYTRRRYVDAFNRQTPAWIRRLFIEVGV